jgi:colanic acid biosynthesis glycosyl transferase WcaI
VLIHGVNFAPEFIGVGKYTTELAVYLQRSGFDVEVITAPPHYPGWRVRSPYKSFRYFKEQIEGVEVRRCPIWTASGGTCLGRLLAPLSFAIAAAPYVFWRILRTRPSVVLCVEPTLLSAPVALLAARLSGSRTILHVQDLEVDAAFAVGHLRSALARRFAHLWEWWTLKKFDRIVTISEKMLQAISLKGIGCERIAVIRNWVALKDIFPQPRFPNSYRRELGFGEADKVALYAGHLGRKQALDFIVSAARDLRGITELKFVIAGEGPEKDALRQQAKGLSNITFLPLQPPERLNDLLSLADFHVLPQNRDVADLTFPSKLGGMLASGRPVIAMADASTELGRLLGHAAILVPPGDVGALKGALRDALNEDASHRVRAGLDIADDLSDKRVLSVFAGLIKETACRPMRENESVGGISTGEEVSITRT